MTEYGRSLSPRLVFEGSPPFERIFEDHGVYLRALLGREVDQAIAHFQRKLTEAGNEEGEQAPAAEVVVNLLVRSKKVDAAIEVAAAHLAGVPDSADASVPSLTPALPAGRPARAAGLAGSPVRQRRSRELHGRPPGFGTRLSR